MKLSAAIDNATPELVAIRRDLHAHPELGLEEKRTSAFIARHLETLGYHVTTGLAKTGVVGTLTNGTGSRSIGIRADIDALPIHEETGLDYASRTPGLMHACGHDGHTAMLLGAARALAERRNFDGTVHLIFQPAEENFGGARIMVEEGLFEKFPCDAIFALHNEPALPFGQFALREGPVMAAVDEARITVHGRGGHGAEPQETADPIVCGASIVMALQSIVSRNIHPMDPAVITVGAFHGGSASNIIPERAEMVVGIRSFDAAVRDELERRIRTIAEAQAESYGMRATIDYERSYDATINHKKETDFVRDLAFRFAGVDKVIDLARPYMGSEDFAYMLKERPGTYFYLGAKATGEEKPLHHPGYDFNDGLLPIGAAFWTELAETYLARS
ncbi:M20 aminoacylase family protein [Sinorhizobium alkalisoli]|uniref:M20 aminoacylase family protein n=1 Tax=Sinorhizobium alkalisoli TaxID=1752398 RepID=UPI00124CCE5E|nr:M20 aminoacylase family protein [Sinorhizobium alkalisoli]MCA1491181.1 amidohydrolase [Ensifer sp. NBAIM29]QFI65042.1 N-acetyl-L,L-diaminopimelate deacetylase [Sinorhizobium alkalisoli]